MDNLFRVCIGTAILIWAIVSTPAVVAQSKKQFPPYEPSSLFFLNAQIISRDTGKPFAGPARRYFTVEESGATQTVFSVEHRPWPLRLVLLVDVTKRPTNAGFLKEQTSEWNTLINSLNLNDEIAVVVTKNRPFLVQGFTNNPQKIRDALTSVANIANNYSPDNSSLQNIEESLTSATRLMGQEKHAIGGDDRVNVVVFLSSLTRREASTTVISSSTFRAFLISRASFCWQVTGHTLSLPDTIPSPGESVSIFDIVGLTGGILINGNLLDRLEGFKNSYRIGFSPIHRLPEAKIRLLKLNFNSDFTDKDKFVLVYPRAVVYGDR